MICPLSESWADGQTRAPAPARGPVGADDGASAQRGEAGAGEAEAAVERALDDRGDGSALGRETAEAVRPPPNGVGAVEVASDDPRYSGIYAIMDTGPAVQGRHIDIYMWSCTEALRFGRRPIHLTVLRLGWSPRATSPSFMERLFKSAEPPPPLPSRPLPAIHTPPSH